jgi:hypothetical protein
MLCKWTYHGAPFQLPDVDSAFAATADAQFSLLEQFSGASPTTRPAQKGQIMGINHEHSSQITMSRGKPILTKWASV